MSLQAGDKLGPYEILACLGAGGMGEVYTARDTRLDRLVAVKVSKQQFSERFEREARAIASLNHPNICQVYDVGPDFLVIEYLEGETLAARLAKGALPLDQTLGIGMQIADALNTAHRKAIVHRDLKPANIMLTKSGAKLLDFGLARIEQNRPASDETLTMAMTTPGTVLGTFQYMAPEQLEAKETDARTDVFAFGAVLYEMLTGRKAFEGKSQASLIAAILEREPAPATTIQPLTPPALEHALKRCLAKDPDSRWQTARDVKAELEWVVSGTEVQQQSKSPPTLLPWIAAAVATLAFLVVAWLHFLEPQPPIAAVRFTISPPEGTRISPGPPWGSPLAVSPDGRRLVFVAIGKDGIRRLWVRVLDVLAAQVLPGTEDASAPFWSPDSERVGFFAGNRLKRVAVSGGEAQTLCQCQTGGGGGTWSKNNVILFSPALAGESGLLRISASGGTPVQVTMLDAARGATNHTWPLFLPDGRHFLYNIAEADGSGIYAGDLESPSRARLMALDVGEMSTLGHASAGYLLYVQDRVLFARLFDAKRLALAGDPIRIVEGVEQVGPGAAAFSVSQNGVLAYWGGAAPRQEQLTWVRRDGTRIAVVGAPGQYLHFALAPDERRVAVTAYDAGARGIPTAIWLLDVLRGTATKFTFDWGAGVPVWSPDASRIALSYDNRPGPPTLYLKPTSGGPRYDLLVEEGGNQPTDWSLDGRTIVHEHRFGVKMQNDLWLLSPRGEHKDRPFLATAANETGGRISPDGRWMAYTSDESGRSEIYLASFPEPLGSTRISTEGGTQAEWRRDGRELYYRTPNRKLMAVSIKAGANFDAGTPHELFELPLEPPPWIQGGADQRVYAPSADGQRFLIAVPLGEESSAPITVVFNWAAGLK